MSNSPKIDPAKTHAVAEFKHERPLTACCYDPRGRYIYFGAEDNLVHRFDPQANSAAPMQAHDSWVRAIGCSPSGDAVYSGGYDGRLVWWTAGEETPRPVRVIEDAHQGWIRALAVSPDGRWIATCGNDNLARLWDAAEGKPAAVLSGHASHVYYAAFHPDGQTLVTCDLKGVLKEWNVASGKFQRDLATASSLYKYDTTFRADIGGARCMAFRGDGKQLAVAGITNVTNAFAGIGEVMIVLVDVAESKVALQLEAKDKIRGAAWGVAHHSDGFWIGVAGGGGGGWFYFWKEDSPQEFFKLKLPNDGRGMSISPDKSRLAVAHADKTLRVYAMS